MMPRLTAPELRAYRRTLAEGPVTVGVQVDVLNNDDEVLASVRPVVLDGQVTVDATADIQRALTITLVDPDQRLGIDTSDTSDGALYADRQLRVRQIIDGPLLAEPVAVPVACGPIVRMNRVGAAVSLEVHDRGHYGLGWAWRSKSWPKGTRKVQVIRDILADYMGETRLGRIQATGVDERLPKAFTLAADDQPWLEAQRLAGSMGLRLYYRADGVPVMAHPTEHTAWRFTDGEGGTVLGEPSITPDFTTISNAVDVTGGAPKPKPRKQKAAAGACEPVDTGRDYGDPYAGGAVESRRPRHARVVAPRNHPLSPYRLGRNGVPLYLPTEVDDDQLRTDREVRRIARRTLRDGLRETTETTFDSAPIPHLEPWDLVGVSTETVQARFRLRQFSFALTGTGPMTLGYVRALTPRRKAIR